MALPSPGADSMTGWGPFCNQGAWALNFGRVCSLVWERIGWTGRSGAPRCSVAMPTHVLFHSQTLVAVQGWRGGGMPGPGRPRQSCFRNQESSPDRRCGLWPQLCC